MLLGAFLMLCLMIFFVSIILSILLLIGYWKILNKMGRDGWPALIPIYGQYVICKEIGVDPIWILISCFSSILMVIPIAGPFLAIAAAFYSIAIFNVSLARSFGHSDLFAMGLAILPFIFLLVLGFDHSEFIGPSPMEDVVFGNHKNVKHNFCTNCGSPLNSNDSFCTNCGTKIN